jgi:hypothetical protein
VTFSSQVQREAEGRPNAPALDPPATATIDPHEGTGGFALHLRGEGHQPLNISPGVDIE